MVEETTGDNNCTCPEVLVTPVMELGLSTVPAPPKAEKVLEWLKLTVTVTPGTAIKAGSDTLTVALARAPFTGERT
jgi:hypothetical protein